MKKYLVRFCSIVCTVVLLCHLNSCKDPAIVDKDNSLGFDPIGLSHIDTTPVLINTVAEIPLQGSGVTTGVLGSMDDPYLGKTYAGFYAQCLLSGNGVTFDNTPVVDSAVLYLPFINDSSKYGKCASPVDVIVYEVNQTIDPTVTYHSDDVFSVNPQSIGRINNYTPNLIDSTRVRGYIKSPQISIKLSSAFAQKLLNTDSSSRSSSTNFVNYLKGIYVTTNTAKLGDGVMYFGLQNCKISMFYHNSQADTLQFDFPITSYSATVNHFDHQYAGRPVQTAISNPSATGDLTGYIQAGVGTKIKLKFPGLSSLPKNIGITKAELIMPVQTSDTAAFPLPAAVTLYRIDDTLAIQSLNVYNNSGVGRLATRVDASGNNYYCYVFSLTEFLQRVLNGVYNNNGFYVQYSYTVRADRAIIKNDPALDNTKCKLKITYTKLQ